MQRLWPDLGVACMWNSLSGYVTIQIKGLMPERLLNRALQDNIVIKNVKRQNSREMHADMRAKDFHLLKKYLRQTSCRVHIIKRYGAPFFIARFRSRKLLLIGSVLLFAALIWASDRLWMVSIEGCETIPETMILRTLEENGIEIGVSTRGLVPSQIANMARGSDERIAWVGAKISGTVLRLEVVEAQIVQDYVPDDTPADIVAKKDGLILDISALCGKANVKPGDVVKAGDVLIRGDITRTDAQESMLVHASGSAIAQVYYTAKVTLPATALGQVRNGNHSSYLQVEISGFPFATVGVDYENYDLEPQRVSSIQGLLPKVKVTSGICWETVLQEIAVDDAELCAQASYEAERRAMAVVDKGAKILSRDVQVTKLQDGSVTAVAGILAEEEIGKTKVLTEYEGE